MLNSDAVTAAVPLATLLDSKGLGVTPIPNSPMEALLNASNLGMMVLPEVEQSTFNKVDLVCSQITYRVNEKDPLLKVCRHDAVMDELRDTISKAVQQHVYFAKTVVRGAIEDLVERTSAAIQSMTPSSLLGMEIKVWNPPQPMLTNGFESLVRKHEGALFDEPAMKLRLPDITVKDMVELMHTGAGTIDKAIDQWMAALSDSFFIELWETCFQIKPRDYNSARSGNKRSLSSEESFQAIIRNKEYGVDAALAIYLLSSKLIGNPIAGTEMTLKEHDDLLLAYRNQAGAQLCRVFDELEQIEKTGILVRNVEFGFKDTSRTVTVVNGSVYKKWIEAGGDNEVLFGNSLQRPSVSTVNNINEKAAEFKQNWERHAAITNSIETGRRLLRVKEALQSSFEASLRDATEDEIASPQNLQRIMGLFKLELERLSEKDLEDIWGTCLKLVCRSRFYRTDAEMILGGIDRISKENPKLSVREAAAISVIEYAAVWVAKQFKIVPA